MASGTIYLGSNNSKLEGRINWSSSSNGPNANTSNVWAELQVRRNDGYTTWGDWTGALNIAGEEQGFTIHESVNTGWVTMKSFTKYNVPHNDDGSGSCWISGYCNGPKGTSLASATTSGNQTVTLDKIPRYLTITGFGIETRQINKVIVKWSVSNPRDTTEFKLNDGVWTGSATYGESLASDQKSGTFNIINLNPNTTYRLKIRCKRTDNQLWTESGEISFTTYDYAKLASVPNINIGASHTITWTNPNNAATTLKLCKTDNTQIISYGTVTGTSKSITPTANTIYALTPNSNTYKARYIITTTQNGKTYTHSKDFTFTVTNSNPTFNNFTYVDFNSNTVKLTGNNKYLIKKHSSVRATISTANKAVAKNSATMKTYRLSIGTKTKDASYNSNADVNIELANIDNNTIIVYAIDSRNNSTSKSITAEKYIDYEDINIKNITLTRSDGGVGQKVTLKYDGYIWNNSFGAENNAITSIKYQYKKTNSSDWIDGKTVLNPTLSGNSYSQTIEIQGDLAGEGFARENSYNFRIIINDKLSSFTKEVTMASGIPLYAYSRNGMAILGPYNESIDAALQVNGKVNATEGISIKTLSGGAGVSGYMKVLSLTITIAYQNQVIILHIIQRGRHGNLYIMFNSSNSTNPSLSYFTKSGSGINARLVKSADGVWDLYIQKSEGYDNIEVTLIEKGSYMKNTKVTWINQTVSSLPSTTDFPTYKDATAEAWKGNADTATKLQTVSLYDNASGTTGTVTLSETAANFSMIEIYFFDAIRNNYNIAKVYSPNGKNVSLSISNYYYTDDSVYGHICETRTKQVRINGTSLSIISYGVGTINYDNKVYVYHINEIKISKIIGYR